MTPTPDGTSRISKGAPIDLPQSGLASLAMISVAAGVVAGSLGAAFRWTLVHADSLRTEWIEAAQHWTAGPIAGFAIVLLACATATAMAAGMVRRWSPIASGSGIPHVEAVFEGRITPASFALIPVKFLGGVLSMGAGLALGREGPSVQIGAQAAHMIGRALGRHESDCRVLLACGAGAGLATAFNAPIAGAAFVLEELVRRFDARTTIATFGASAGAIAIGRLVFGQQPDFTVHAAAYSPHGMIPVHLLLGMALGVLGVAYNRAIVGSMDALVRWRGVSVEVKAGMIGAVVGMIAWCAPSLVGGGESIAQRTLTEPLPLTSVTMMLLLRLALGPICYAAQTPGGLFAPLLAVGSLGGAAFALVVSRIAPSMAFETSAFAIVGMAAFFTAVVRAPLTGIILVIEMTGGMTLLLPMLAACFGAMLMPTLLRNPPIYDTLRDQTISNAMRSHPVKNP